MLQGQLTWASPPKLLRLAEPYLLGVLGDSVQILPLQSSVDAMQQASSPAHAAYPCLRALICPSTGPGPSALPWHCHAAHARCADRDAAALSRSAQPPENCAHAPGESYSPVVELA